MVGEETGRFQGEGCADGQTVRDRGTKGTGKQFQGEYCAGGLTVRVELQVRPSCMCAYVHVCVLVCKMTTQP